MVGCWKHEKEALININGAYFHNSLPWVDSIDCCKWDRVECNSTTRRVVKLDLSNGSHYNPGLWLLNYSHFLAFEDMKNLNLSFNDISSCVETEASGLNNLEVLDLGYNYGTGNILSCVLESSSLKVLNIRNNKISSTSYQGELNACLFSQLINLEVLDLTMSEFSDDDDDVASALSALPSLKSLSLVFCRLNSKSIHSLSKLRTLEILDLAMVELEDSNLWSSGLSGNSFSKKIFSSLSGLRHLKSVDLSRNQLEGSLNISGLAPSNLEILDFSQNDITNLLVNQDWSGLKTLKELYIGANNFKGPLQPYFANFQSLKMLDLSYNYFTGNIGSSLASLTSLEYLAFEGNQFEVPISFTPFFNHSTLKFIYGNGNKVILDSHSTMDKWVPKFQLQVLSLSSTTKSHSLPLPSFLHYQYNLTYLDFSGWKLEGEFPKWLLENNKKMTNLVLKNCSFTQFQLPSHPHLHLEEMDVSDNTITGQIMGYNISSFFPKLEILDMSANAIDGPIPREYGQMKLLKILDLSNNRFSGEIPHELINMSSLQTIDLSHNQLSGEITKAIFGVRHQSPGHISSLDISNNQLVGKIPSLIKNISGLEQLRMSNNHFEGSIPPELAELKNLMYLDLSQNNLIGVVPPFVGSWVKVIHLNNNYLCGLSKRMFRGSSSLEMLDLSHNEVTYSIQDMVEDLNSTYLNILLLGGNHFNGDIPRQLCNLIDLNILDLSHNNLTGVIPKCLGEMPFENANAQSRRKTYGTIHREPNSRFYRQLPNVQVNFTTKGRTDSYIGIVLAVMSAIDLSHNKLQGNIPSELGNLKGILSLNLSHNDLTGHIPTTFSNLLQTETLDLSFNKLSGQIPPQLNELTSLSSFSVAYNNLSGAIPERKGQFMTFKETCFRGNPLLCGPPLTKSCNPSSVIISNDSDSDGESGSWVDMFIFCVTFAASYTSFWLVTAVALHINPYLSQACFYYAKLVSLKCYYFVKDKFCRFCKIGNV
ncbi:unnamed protein product [Sphenostylis stenocarpa]|uniref:Leucine-rich repeat-containing N-terminal plant-type domain-containing protein n=1 Tax=Sphenostylis stenocarpa TaxID=92480 RepID=A0AA86S9E6_9FABA|nr:unnamed protein product [Sphenostylis stenocarpa]